MRVVRDFFGRLNDRSLSDEPFFQAPQQEIQKHCNDTEDQDGEDDPVQLEDLTAVDDHVAKTLLGADKFSDDDTDEAQSDVHLHNGEQICNVGGKYDLKENM